MAINLDDLDWWRKYFDITNSTLFVVIEKAFMLAARDCLEEFKLRKDQIVERLLFYTSENCSNFIVMAQTCDYELRGGQVMADNVQKKERIIEEIIVNKDDHKNGKNSDREIEKNHVSLDKSGCFKTKEEKILLCNDLDEVYVNTNGNDLHQEVEGLSIEREASAAKLFDLGQDGAEANAVVVHELLKINRILDNAENHGDEVCLELLKKLQGMYLTPRILKVTWIARTVSQLQKYESEEVRDLACKLTRTWMKLADEWEETLEPSGAGGLSHPMQSPLVENEGLLDHLSNIANGVYNYVDVPYSLSKPLVLERSHGGSDGRGKDSEMVLHPFLVDLYSSTVEGELGMSKHPISGQEKSHSDKTPSVINAADVSKKPRIGGRHAPKPSAGMAKDKGGEEERKRPIPEWQNEKEGDIPRECGREHEKRSRTKQYGSSCQNASDSKMRYWSYD